MVAEVAEADVGEVQPVGQVPEGGRTFWGLRGFDPLGAREKVKAKASAVRVVPRAAARCSHGGGVEAQATGSVGLGVLLGDVAADVDEGTVDEHRPDRQIEVRPTQCAELSPAGTGHRADQEEHAESGVVVGRCLEGRTTSSRSVTCRCWPVRGSRPTRIRAPRAGSLLPQSL